jgi:hypothetical protein
LIATRDKQADPDQFQKLLDTHLAAVAPVLAKCLTVWVIGDLRRDGPTAIVGKSLDQFARVIADFCQARLEGRDPKGKKFLVVELSRKPSQRSGPNVGVITRDATLREITL